MGMKEARAELEKKVKVWEQNLDTLANELKVMHSDLEKKKASMTKKERELSTELFNTKQQQFQNYRQSLQERLKTEDEKLTTQVLGNINQLIEQYGDRHGYTIIFGATTDGNIVYGDKGIDVTDAIITLANENYIKK
jgi:outer membrane protein